MYRTLNVLQDHDHQGWIHKIQKEGAEKKLARAQHRSKPQTHEHPCGVAYYHSNDGLFQIKKQIRENRGKGRGPLGPPLNTSMMYIHKNYVQIGRSIIGILN